MAVEVTLRLPENMMEYARRFGEATQRDVDQVLADTLELMWVTLDVENIDLPVSSLSDDAVLKLANTKMDRVQNERLVLRGANNPIAKVGSKSGRLSNLAEYFARRPSKLVCLNLGGTRFD